MRDVLNGAVGGLVFGGLCVLAGPPLAAAGLVEGRNVGLAGMGVVVAGVFAWALVRAARRAVRRRLAKRS